MFRFTIRDVLLVMVIVGLAVGWCIDHRRQRAAWDQSQTMFRMLDSFLEREGYKASWTHGNTTLTILRPGEN